MPAFEEITIALAEAYPAYARYWGPPRPVGAVLYHHGIQSHCGWYEQSAASLCHEGYAVLQFDRRGCGRNEVQRGHAESADQLIADAVLAGEELRRRSGFEAFHVVGVSWGGKLAVACYVREPEHTLSLSLVTPGLFPRVGASKTEMARIGFAMLYEPSRLFDIPLNEAELFTTNARWKDFIERDPLTLRKCSAGFYLASRRMDRVVARLKESPPTQIHLMLACDERIVDNTPTADFVRDLHWPGTRITWYRGARHSLEFEGDTREYLSDLAAFLGS